MTDTNSHETSSAQPNVLQLEFVVVRPFDLDASDKSEAYHRVLHVESENDEPDEEDWRDATVHLRRTLKTEGLQGAMCFPLDFDFSDAPADLTLQGRAALRSST